jgi:hypothetical protein
MTEDTTPAPTPVALERRVRHLERHLHGDLRDE